MSEQGQETNKSEEATPFKLKRAREKGMVARGMDLGFFASLAALASFLIMAGEELVGQLALLMRRSLGAGIANAADPQQAAALAAAVWWPALQPVLLLAGTVVLFVLLLEVVQLRGLIFSTHPLKPDFSRLNPAKGLKRIFSMRMLKEAMKNVVKMTIYATIAYLLIAGVVDVPGRSSTDAAGLAAAMQAAGMRLLLFFILAALFFVAIDQIIARRDYSKQMRMSRRELTREHKEREGEPRLKQKRKQLHAEFAKEARQAGSLPGSDMLVVNPTHFAVALAYRANENKAPRVTAKARNERALAMKSQAFLLGIPIFESKALARALYDQTDTGDEIGESRFRDVADLYLKLQTSGRNRP